MHTIKIFPLSLLTLLLLPLCRSLTHSLTHFLTHRRLNVAITRAMSHTIVLGDMKGLAPMSAGGVSALGSLGAQGQVPRSAA